jgi:hypothetical protein
MTVSLFSSSRNGSVVASQPTVEVGLSLLVAIYTESHLEHLEAQPVHRLHLAVAFLTGDFLPDMPLVAEENVLGQIDRVLPGSGNSGIKILVLLPDLRMTGNNIIMAIEAFFHRGKPG